MHSCPVPPIGPQLSGDLRLGVLTGGKNRYVEQISDFIVGPRAANSELEQVGGVLMRPVFMSGTSCSSHFHFTSSSLKAQVEERRSTKRVRPDEKKTSTLGNPQNIEILFADPTQTLWILTVRSRALCRLGPSVE